MRIIFAKASKYCYDLFSQKPGKGGRSREECINNTRLAVTQLPQGACNCAFYAVINMCIREDVEERINNTGLAVTKCAQSTRCRAFYSVIDMCIGDDVEKRINNMRLAVTKCAQSTHCRTFHRPIEGARKNVEKSINDVRLPLPKVFKSPHRFSSNPERSTFIQYDGE